MYIRNSVKMCAIWLLYFYNSQVTRAAIQTFVIMFSLLGKDIETSKSLETTLQILLTKTADTNRFDFLFYYYYNNLSGHNSDISTLRHYFAVMLWFNMQKRVFIKIIIQYKFPVSVCGVFQARIE